MNLKDDLLNFFTGNDNATETDLELMPHDQASIFQADGLCVVCDNRAQCIWRENNKLYCEHYG